jgi:hypothetical protein
MFSCRTLQFSPRSHTKSLTSLVLSFGQIRTKLCGAGNGPARPDNKSFVRMGGPPQLALFCGGGLDFVVPVFHQFIGGDQFVGQHFSP